MKTLLLAVAMYFIVVPGDLSALEEIQCGTDGSEAELFDPAETHGIYLPAKGELKILVVFARFKDDGDPHFDWPVGSDPNDYETWIDPNMQTGSTNLANFTHYYKTMSLNSFKVTGTAVSVETPQNRSYYFSLSNPQYEATKDVLRNKVDHLVNFADFDNWTYVSNYNHTNQPDGTVDMIVVMWRGQHFGGWAGEASLGKGSSFTVENGTMTIATRYRSSGQAGSGVTVHYLDKHSKKYSFHAAIHEVAHWLLGGRHPYSGQPRYGTWGMLSAPFSDGISANTYDRERLGWITPSTAVLGDASLSDFITTGEAYKFHPSDGDPNEYLYFENHQKQSIYDDATTNSNDKGIWVIHQRDVYNGTHNIRLKPQDGFWSWENPYDNTTCFPGGADEPAFRKLSVDRNLSGLSNRDKLPNSPSGLDWMHIYIDQTGSELCGGFFRGDPPFFGAFNPTINNVFSRWSNPAANTWTDAPVDFAMHVAGQSGAVLNVIFYVGAPASAPPSKPQNLRLTNYKHKHGFQMWNHPKLVWDTNGEPDMVKYHVYRNSPKVAEVIHNPSQTTHSWIDHFVNMDGGPNTYDYTVTGVDNTAKESTPSDEVTAYTTLPSRIGLDIVSLPKEFDLKQNHPNPFNPVTTIKYNLPENSLAILRVYDLMGHEITTLVDGNVEAGHRSVIWNGLDNHGNPVSSGMYLYRIDARAIKGDQEFHMTRKMILLR